MDAHRSLQDTQRLVDKEIADTTARAQESIRLLKTRQNQLASVSTLPDEVLLHIFVRLRDMFLDNPKNWLPVTHVCRYWRHVGVGSPSLWTRLYNPPPGLTPLMLERSRNAPLEVSLSGNEHQTPVSDETLSTILLKIERIQMLNIQGMPVEVLEMVEDVFEELGPDREASLLEVLTVDLEINVELEDPPLSLDVFRLTPLLRRFCTSGGHYEWDMLPFPSLNGITHLELYGEHLGEVSVADFLDTLRNMHSLEHLGFMWDRMNLYYFPATSPPPKPIELPCLRRLEILEARQPEYDFFLSLLTYPKLHRLSTYPTFIDVVPFIKSILSAGDRGNFDPLEFLTIGQEDVTISSKPRLSDYPEGSFISMFLSSDSPNVGETPEDRDFDFVMDVISCITPFDSPDKIPLRHISLYNWDASIDKFIRTFGSLPHLETFEVYQKLALVLFKALDTTKSARPGEPIPFQNLRSVTWHGQHIHDHHPTQKIPSTAFSDLYNSLLSRRACGAPTLKLELVRCEALEDTQIDQLKKIGAEVVIRDT